jgi:hypothetical protein
MPLARHTTVTESECQATIAKTKMKIANSLRLLRQIEEQQVRQKRA